MMNLRLKKLLALAYIVVTIFFVFNALMSSVNLSPLYPESAFFYCVMITAYLGIAVIYKKGLLVLLQPIVGAQVDYEPKKRGGKVLIIIIVFVWAAYAVVNILSSVLFNVPAYRDQMPDYETGDFSENIQAIDTTQIPIVDEHLAMVLAEKKLGERPSLGSQVVLGTPTIQTVDSKLLWVVPLEHSGFFQWLTNMEGTPGYITVSATNTQDVEYIENYPVKYQDNAFFFHNLSFHTRYTAALFTGVTDYSFELNDEGVPHWVITTYKTTRGFALPEATGVIVMDAATGASERYSLENIPDWVDRVQPEHFILNQINNKGQYVHGVFNFSDRDKYQTSDGHIIVYNEGRCYLFTGITSVGADESAIGFVMVDMVTKEPVMYQMAGATEYAAQGSAEGKVQQFGYYASFPVIVNMNGVPTYFMTLKDNDGLIKQYACVSVKDFLIVGVGESIVEAQQNYEKALLQNPSASLDVTASEASELTGTVLRIASENEQLLIYRIIIEEQPELLFDITSTISPELAITLPGDRVKIAYNEVEAAVQNVTEFDNLEFEQEE